MSHSSSGWESEVKVSQGLFLLGMDRETLFQASVLSSSGLLAISAVPCLVDTWLPSLPSCSHGTLLVCGSEIPLLIKTPVIDFRAHSTLLDLILISSAPTLFQIRPYSEILEVNISKYESGEAQSGP